MSRRDHEQRPDSRVGWYRKLDLIGPDGRTFLRRRGIDAPLGGVLIHWLDGPDPGLDLHDHPWSFVTLILRGGYTERWAESRDACLLAELTDRGGRTRYWPRWSIHTMPTSIAHRITAVEPGTITLVIRTPKRRVWGFFMPRQWVPWTDYDYDARRPLTVESNKAEERLS